MRWETFKKETIKKASINEYTEAETSTMLEYAETLFRKKLPVIYEPMHFSKLVGYNLGYVCGAANAPKKYYRSFMIPKKDGTKRQIYEPLPSLKEIQRYILHEILYNIPISVYAKGFVKKKSIKTAATYHTKMDRILTVDVKDFFPSIKFPRVYQVFRNEGYTTSVSGLLAGLCCLNGELPQGAPTSPCLSNIICSEMDNKLWEIAKKYEAKYTRYADDIIFSFNGSGKNQIFKDIGRIVRAEGFALNLRKTKIMKRGTSQRVVGIVVNEKMSVNREYKRRIRQEMYYIKKYGLESHLETSANMKRDYIASLNGKINHVLFIEKTNSEFAGYKKEIEGSYDDNALSP